VKQTGEWNIYRTRFLVRAKQLTESLEFTDALGREHHGEIGDYLVESSDGTTRVTPKAIFEDIYVLMSSVRKDPLELRNSPKPWKQASSSYPRMPMAGTTLTRKKPNGWRAAAPA
jgi:hypothetical protein